MIERVAMAIDADGVKAGLADEHSAEAWRLYTQRFARVAIKAMREPTEAMLDAVWEPDNPCSMASWKGMIDTALMEDGGKP